MQISSSASRTKILRSLLPSNLAILRTLAAAAHGGTSTSTYRAHHHHPTSSSAFGADDLSSDVEKLYRILRKFHSRPPKLALALGDSGVPLRPGLVERVIARCGDAGTLAFRFFSWASRCPDYFPSPTAHRAMVKSLAKMRHFGAAWALVDEMRREAPDLVTPDIFVAFIRRFAAARLVSKAIEVLDEMPKYGCEPDDYVFGCLLDALCKNGSVKEAALLFEDLKERFSPNLKHFTSLLYGWCKLGKLIEAKFVLVQMRQAGFEPDNVVYNTLLGGFAAAGKIEDGYELLREMRRQGCEPNAISYTTLIQAFCSRDRMDEAMRVFVEMTRNGCAADAVTFNTLISGFCKSGKISRGYEFIDAMVQQGCKPDPSTYFSIFAAHEKKEELEECLELMESMSKGGILPDLGIYNTVIRLACKLGELSQAITIWNEMESSRLSPGLDTFVIMVHGFIKQGSLIEACGYFKEMVGRGLFATPQYGILKDLLNALLRAEKLEMAKEVWGCIVSKGCELNVYAWTIWIHALYSNKHVKEACSYFLDMLDAGLMPQPDTFAKLLKGLKKLYNRHIAAEITEKVRKMAEERHVTFKMYKRRGVRLLEEKVKAKAKRNKRKGRELHNHKCGISPSSSSSSSDPLSSSCLRDLVRSSPPIPRLCSPFSSRRRRRGEGEEGRAKEEDDVLGGVFVFGRDPTRPPRLFVVQPRLRPDSVLQWKLSEALNLANSLEEPRDGFYAEDFESKELPPHLVVQNPARRAPRVRNEIDAIFVNAILSGIQQRNLEFAWKKPVLDRVGLIIQIFNAHAETKEAKLQSELAALMYMKTRLVRVRGPGGRLVFGASGEAEVVSARGRGSGGRGFISGAGETELHLQRRRIQEKQNHLLSQIEEVRRTRALQRSARKRHGSSYGRGLETVAVVGYTNAGKSTLVGALSESDLYSDDRLFATVDPRLRSVILPSGKKALLSDTVGFISDLPVQLVEAFHATLEEVVEADLLVHVLDSSAPDLDEQRLTVLQVLQQIGVSEEKIQNMIEVWNKIDLVDKNIGAGEFLGQDDCLGEGEEQEDGEFSEAENDMASELPSGEPINEDDMVSELSQEENQENVDDMTPELSDEPIDEDDMASELSAEEGLQDLDEQEAESPVDWKMTGPAIRNESKNPNCVQTSAVMGIGLQELLNLIDEKLNTQKPSPQEKIGPYDRKWRPYAADGEKAAEQ
ncbi:uncharacterized protein LOC103704272 [Phoenix dactylifera]|uniref:Uncharacterized protein LOC103704272 n=1 Tax=Phoenix dactylifera TaxID=42345 RepID=A0A8B9AUD2_PHODC|nr:uncharacterized protein LOC103704272 [Phoenix dactylifera]